MVGPLDRTARQNHIPIRVPDHDAGHNAHSIKSAVIDVNEDRTEFLVQPFQDRIFVLVSQNKKMGTVLSAEREVTLAGAESFSVNVLIGKRDVPEMELCARTIIASMSADGCEKPLLLSMALKNHSMRTMRTVIETVKELRVW